MFWLVGGHIVGPDAFWCHRNLFHQSCTVMIHAYRMWFIAEVFWQCPHRHVILPVHPLMVFICFHLFCANYLFLSCPHRVLCIEGPLCLTGACPEHSHSFFLTLETWTCDFLISLHLTPSAVFALCNAVPQIAISQEQRMIPYATVILGTQRFFTLTAEVRESMSELRVAQDGRTAELLSICD